MPGVSTKLTPLGVRKISSVVVPTTEWLLAAPESPVSVRTSSDLPAPDSP